MDTRHDFDEQGRVDAGPARRPQRRRLLRLAVVLVAAVALAATGCGSSEQPVSAPAPAPEAPPPAPAASAASTAAPPAAPPPAPTTDVDDAEDDTDSPAPDGDIDTEDGDTDSPDGEIDTEDSDGDSPDGDIDTEDSDGDSPDGEDVEADTEDSEDSDTEDSDGGEDSDTEDTGDIDAYLDQLEADGYDGVVGYSLDGEQTIRAFGVADRENNIPVREDTVFSTGSITKQFTGAAILRMEMDGLLSVEDRIGDYVTGLPPAHADLTLHQLLTHSAGLPGGLGSDWDPVDRDAMVTLIADRPLQGDIGATFNYSNVGYSLLGMVIETISGQSYEEYLAEALFEPAGMPDTGYLLPGWDADRVAVGYDGGEPFGRPNELPWGDDGPYWHLRANGGIMSTAADMLAWHEALLGDDILDADAKAKLFARHIEEGDGAETFYGYGWASFPTASGGWATAHNGGNGIWFADFWRFVDESLTVYVATNDVQSLEQDDIAIRIAEEILGTSVLADGFDSELTFSELVEQASAAPEIDDFPDTGEGEAARALYEVYFGDNDPNYEQFLLDRAPTWVLDGIEPEELAENIEDFRLDREYFEGATVTSIRMPDDSTFLILVDGTEGPAIVTVVAGPDRRLVDIGISDDPK